MMLKDWKKSASFLQMGEDEELSGSFFKVNKILA